MIVRPAEFSDSKEIASIWNPYIKDTFVTFNAVEKNQEEVCSLIKDRRNDGHEFWVAIRDDKVVGFASYAQLRTGVGYRYSMEHTIIISDKYKSLGIGKNLMGVLCAHAKKRDINSMWAGVSALNTAAIKFHEGLEFKTVARLPEVGYKFGSLIDLVLMRKLL